MNDISKNGKTKEKVCRTIHQYNKESIAKEDMAQLKQIAKSYQIVKNYIYCRYGGIHSLSKITPGYEVQKELIAQGYREQINLPSVYFQNAIYDALGDIRGALEKCKKKILKSIYSNENLSEDDRHYLNYVLRVDQALFPILEHKNIVIPKKLEKTYIELSEKVDTNKLNNYLRRQYRKHSVKLHTEINTVFSVDYRGYRYENHGIYLASSVKMKRIFIPLTDTITTDRQIVVKLDIDNQSIELLVPINVAVKKHEDYVNEVGIAPGIETMLTTDNGNSYGIDYGKLQESYSIWLRETSRKRSLNTKENQGYKKYNSNKHKQKEKIQSYINHEVKRLIETEKPKIIYIPKLPQNTRLVYGKNINYKLLTWQRSMIYDSIEKKCQQNAIELVWVLAEGTAKTCSRCGFKWDNTTKVRVKEKDNNKEKVSDIIKCPACGLEIHERQNTAINAKSRGQQKSGINKNLKRINT